VYLAHIFGTQVGDQDQTQDENRVLVIIGGHLVERK
jgi:hypothetical protein